MKHNNITSPLLEWYQENKRDLPWRKQKDPYNIWLSEIILQQTRVDQGLPYYLAFIEKYPTVFDLANADEDDVLRTWQGLGYYSRARNLHKCAKIILEEHSGVFPSTRNELMKLPGVGPYTSAAIASFAFGKKEAVVDGNVIRVISRIYGIEEDISELKTISRIRSIAESSIPADVPDLFNQAIMEFGALFCTPKNPACDECRLQEFCVARHKNVVAQIPYKSKKVKKRIRHFSYLLVEIREKILMRKRVQKDIWNGLFEFYLIENETIIDFDAHSFPSMLSEQANEWALTSESKNYKHLLTHQTIMCRFFHLKVSDKFIYIPSDWEDYQLYSTEEIEQLPKSVLIDRFLQEK